jgi:hypothetical protein
MKNFAVSLRGPALIGLLLTLPFLAMELVNRRAYHEPFPFPLFVLLWLLPVMFVLTLSPIVRDLRAGRGIPGGTASALLKTSLLFLLAWMWISLIVDQMPCFLGAQLCD